MKNEKSTPPKFRFFEWQFLATIVYFRGEARQILPYIASCGVPV